MTGSVLKICLILSTCFVFLQCKATKKPNSDPGPSSKDDVVSQLLGENVKIDPVPTGPTSAATDKDLKCDFEAPCCWQNAKPPRDQLEWARANGLPDPNKFYKSFGTSIGTTGNYLVVATTEKPSETDAANFYSCPIACTNENVKVSLKYWKTSNVKLKVCLQEVTSNNTKGGELLNCQLLPSDGQPGPKEVTLPPMDNFNIVIVATGFSSKSLAMIDDIEVTVVPCSSVTQADPPASTPSASGLCQAVVCNFEQNTPCSYQNSQNPADSGRQKTWEVAQGRYNNLATGIRKPGDGSVYLATYLAPNDTASCETSGEFNEDRVIKFLVYKVADKIELKGCCDDTSKCPYSTEKDVKASDFNKWRDASFQCPKGTKKVLFQGNNKGNNLGAIGLDNIQLLVPSGTSSDTAQQNAC
jgi:hypothetical protein